MMRDIRHHSPASNHDFDFFFNGLEEARLLVQQCPQCGRLRNPPAPFCSACQAAEFETAALSGAGEVYSYTIHHHPPLPEFPVPHIVVVAQMAEGVRVVANLAGVMPEDGCIGMKLRTEFYRRGDLATLQFRADSDVQP